MTTIIPLLFIIFLFIIWIGYWKHKFSDLKKETEALRDDCLFSDKIANQAHDNFQVSKRINKEMKKAIEKLKLQKDGQPVYILVPELKKTKPEPRTDYTMQFDPDSTIEERIVKFEKLLRSCDGTTFNERPRRIVKMRYQGENK